MLCVDVSFRITATQPIAADHGYHLYAALSRICPEIHQQNGMGIHPISGRQVGNRQMALLDGSRLTFRTETTTVASLIQLAGNHIDVGGTQLNIGIPDIHAIEPASNLRSRLVTTRNCEDQSRFERELRRQLDVLNVTEDVHYSIGKRRTICIKNKEIVGYELSLKGLTASDSLSIQFHGLGGRRHMGCGLFVKRVEDNR